jgi:hypothetical protein
MGFKIRNRFEFSTTSETKPVTEEFKKSRRNIIVEFDKECISFKVVQKESIIGNDAVVIVLSVDWEFGHNVQNNAYTAACFIDGDHTRQIDLDPNIGQYVYHLVNGFHHGEIMGNISSPLIRFIFRELEIKNAPKDSWVEEYFPRLFKHEETAIERQQRKIVKDVMKT